MNREIDRRIAELMGFMVVESGQGEHVIYDDVYGYKDIPEYSSDWNAMRMLVEWLQGKRVHVEMIIGGGGCEVVLRSDGGWNDHGSYSELTAPLALCNAVLSLPSEVLQDA